ncbi:hypothetical protein [Mumia sp. DW29H23]|uniref:hypothetical protein n=1 Tax=Mumia sp. DW29H23 TaxID=3421241 RepID=UPI003D68262B
MAEHRRRRAALALTLLLAGVGAAVALATAPWDPGARPDEAAAPAGVPSRGVAPGSTLDELRACFRETEELNLASVTYPPDADLTQADAETYTVTLASTPLGEPGDVSEELQVACTVSARLVGSPTELEISPAGWVEQQYVPPEPTRWTWVVTGRSAGESDAVLEVRPAIRVADSHGSTQVEELRTEQFDVVFATSATPGQRLTSLWAGLVAVATGLGAILGAWFLVRRVRGGPAPGSARAAPPSRGRGSDGRASRSPRAGAARGP